jgi:uncharacterized SAM-binding protein YcdF (DUF218 family)
MYFIFSKLLLILILPFSWFLAFLIAALVVKKQHLKRRFLIISAVIMLLFSNPFLFSVFAHYWDIKPVPLKKTGSYSCAIVLGGFSGEDGKGHGFFNSSADRFIEALKLLTTGKVTHILISSGNGNLIHGNFAEADWVQTQLKQLNVPDSCVLIENRSRNTIENAAFSKIILNKSHLQPPYILVTSAFHMRRSLNIFKKTKLDVIPYPCNYMAGENNISLDGLIPDAAVLGNWNYYTKEVVGNIVVNLK